MCIAPQWLSSKRQLSVDYRVNKYLKYKTVMSGRNIRSEPYISKPGGFLTKFDHASLYLAKSHVIGTCYKYNLRNEDIKFMPRARKKKCRNRWVDGNSHDPSIEFAKLEKVFDSIPKTKEVQDKIRLLNEPYSSDVLYHTPKRFHRNMPKFNESIKEVWIRGPYKLPSGKIKLMEKLRKWPVCDEIDPYPQLRIPEMELIEWQNRFRRSLLLPLDIPNVFRCDYASLDLNRGDHPGAVPFLEYSEIREGPIIVWRTDDEILNSHDPMYLMLPPQNQSFLVPGAWEEIKAMLPTPGIHASINPLIRRSYCLQYFSDNIEAKQRFALLMIKTFISLDEPYPFVYGINQDFLRSFIETVKKAFLYERPGL